MDEDTNVLNERVEEIYEYQLVRPQDPERTRGQIV